MTRTSGSGGRCVSVKSVVWWQTPCHIYSELSHTIGAVITEVLGKAR